MEPVYCPNGHPNRPGTRICIVCRELIAPSSPAPTGAFPPAKPEAPPARVVAPPSAQPPAPTTGFEPLADETAGTAPAGGRRWWPWLLLLLLVAAASAALLLVLNYPARPTITQSPTQPATSVPAAVANTAITLPSPTASPALTSTASPTKTGPAATKPPTAVSTITPLPTILGVIITPTLAFGPEVNFIQNGDFADDWANGWTPESRGEAAEAEVGPATDEPGTQSLHLARTGPGMSRLGQRVVLTFPVEGLVFRGRFRLVGTAADDAEGRAFILLRYEDANGVPVGATIWLDDSAASTDLWGDTPLPEPGFAVSEHSGREGWQDVELPLLREFAGKLSDVDMESVRQVTVLLGVIGAESCPASGCEAMLEVAELSLTAEMP